MSPLNEVGSYSYYPPQEELPLELFQKVLSYLDDDSLQQTAAVSRYWSAVSIDTARNKHFSQITNLVKFLDDNLSDGHGFSAIPIGVKILGSVNLIQVKSSTDELIEQILRVLKDLDENALKELHADKYFNNIFDSARLYKKIEEASQISDEDARNQQLCSIAKALAECGRIEKATQIAEVITSNKIGWDALKNICLELALSGRIHKAARTVLEFIRKRSPDDYTYEDALWDISYEFAKSGNIDKSKEVAIMISDQMKQSMALTDLTTELRNLRDLEKAIDIAQTIPIDAIRADALYYICTVLVIDNIDQALEVASLMPEDFTIPQNHYSRGDALSLISGILAERGDTEKAWEVASMISDQTRYFRVLHHIINH